MVKELEYRETLSKWIIGVSIGGVIALAVIVIAVSGNADTTKLVFTAVLPLFAAWVGTILAFYYGRENFEAATRSVTKMAETVGLMEKLKEIPVTSEMRARKDMIVEQRPADQIKLTEILNKLSKIERLPILNTDGAIIYLIHRSAIDRYMAQKALQPTPPNLQDLTLKTLLDDDSNLKYMFEQSFAFVRENATLADAKIEMEKKPKCQDVFVTRSGAKSEPVIGWITNNTIQKLAKL